MEPHGSGTMIINHPEAPLEHNVFDGLFKNGKFEDGEELQRFEGGKILLLVYEDGEKVEQVEGHEDNPEKEEITDLRK